MGVYFEVVGWEEVPSGIGSDPQDVVNRYIEGEYDVFLGLMGATLGSPTGRAASGTVSRMMTLLARKAASESLLLMNSGRLYRPAFSTERLLMH
jgi:hypothetical protein